MAFYAGPDQVMTVTSGIASVLGFLLIFWNKLIAVFSKLVQRFRHRAQTPSRAGSWGKKAS